MALSRAQKEELAKELQDCFSRSQVAVFADYKGLSSPGADELRRRLRESNCEVRVLKNNVARLAVKGSDFGDETRALLDGLVGPTLVAFGYGDPVSVAKAVQEFAKDHEALELKDGLMGDKRIAAAEVEQLAKLPSREQLLGMLLSTMNGPARGFVTALSGVPRGFVTVLDAIAKKKEEQA